MTAVMLTERITWNGEWHPFAERFPMLTEQELREMAESIAETGQLHPCVMTPNGLGLDGRNRVAACRIASVEPEWVIHDGNPLSVIIAANVHHRFLTTGQRAMAVAIELAEKGMRQNGRWRRGSVPEPDSTESRNTWKDAMMRAGVILDWLPDKHVDEVLAGAVALDVAFTQAKERRDAENARAAKLEQLPSDLAALVDAGVRELDDALAEAEDRRTVTKVDAVRVRDGDPGGALADRARDGALSWREAAQLARQWLIERDEAIARHQVSVCAVNEHWGAIRTIHAMPDKPFVADVIAGLGEPDREALTRILEQLKE